MKTTATKSPNGLNTCNQIAEAHKATVEVNIMKGFPVLVNDIRLTAQCKEVAAQLTTVKQVHDLPIRMGAEDFAYYTQHTPACFYRVGVGNKAAEITSPIHSPTFDIDEQALRVSMTLMCAFATQNMKL